MKRATHLHDRVNLFVLPVLGGLTLAGQCIYFQQIQPQTTKRHPLTTLCRWLTHRSLVVPAAGLLGLANPVHVSVIFTLYIVLDFFWICFEQDAVPSLPGVILAHHIVTMVLLSFPLRYPHLAMYTCWDGLAEINTWFLISRRQWKGLRKPLSFCYWATFFPTRIILYPYLLASIYEEMKVHSWFEMVLCCGCQFLLILFNFALLGLSIMNWSKKKYRAPSPTVIIPASGDDDVASPKKGDGVVAGGKKCVSVNVQTATLDTRVSSARHDGKI